MFRRKPRKHPERVQHERIKPPIVRAPTAAERRHWSRIVSLGCLVCGGPATVHHVTAPIEGGRIARSHQLVVPLCRPHHQHDYGPESVERLSHGGFFKRFGIDLLAEAKRLWAISEGLERERQNHQARR